MSLTSSLVRIDPTRRYSVVNDARLPLVLAPPETLVMLELKPYVRSPRTPNAEFSFARNDDEPNSAGLTATSELAQKLENVARRAKALRKEGLVASWVASHRVLPAPYGSQKLIIGVKLVGKHDGPNDAKLDELCDFLAENFIEEIGQIDVVATTAA